MDRLPWFPILIAPACELTGVKQGDYSQDPAVMADTLIRARELIGADGIYVSRDNWVAYEALGGTMTFAEDDEPNGSGPLLDRVGDFRQLAVPDPEAAPGMHTVLAAARRVVAAAGNDFYIQANIDCGPFSLAAILRGTQNFMLDLVTEAEGEIHDYLEFCTRVVAAYGKAMAATGVHGVQYGDATASLISPEHYRRFVLPYQAESLRAMAAPGVDLWVHICGDTRHLLPLLRDLPFQGFELDAKVGLRETHAQLGDKALKGNLDTTFLLRESPEAVYEGTLGMLERGGLATGLVVSPGCGVPRMTPLENLRAMGRACACIEQ